MVGVESPSAKPISLIMARLIYNYETYFKIRNVGQPPYWRNTVQRHTPVALNVVLGVPSPVVASMGPKIHVVWHLKLHVCVMCAIVKGIGLRYKTDVGLRERIGTRSPTIIGAFIGERYVYVFRTHRDWRI